MEQARHTFLDNATANLAELLKTQNDAAKDIKTEKQSTIKYMGENKVHSYVQNGIRLTHQPGVDKLSVRPVKEEGETVVSDDNASERAGSEE